MKNIIPVLIVLLSFTASAQKELNNYKYIVIPARYDFQKTANLYQLNSLLKHKFNQLGLEAYLDTDDLPQEVKTNSCSYLKAIINAKSNMFATKATIDLVDCDKQVAYRTQEGKSISKNIRASYLESVRAALKSFDDFQYQYEPKEIVVEVEEVEVEKEKPIIVNKDKVSVSAIKQKDSISNFYNYDNRKLKLEKNKEGFSLVDNDTKEEIGYLRESSITKNIYHFKLKEDINGIGYFQENGDVIFEYINKKKIMLIGILPKL